jgi:hypothetical protein
LGSEGQEGEFAVNPDPRIDKYAVSLALADIDLIEESVANIFTPETRQKVFRILYKLALVTFEHYEESSDRVRRGLMPSSN